MQPREANLGEGSRAAADHDACVPSQRSALPRTHTCRGLPMSLEFAIEWVMGSGLAFIRLGCYRANRTTNGPYQVNSSEKAQLAAGGGWARWMIGGGACRAAHGFPNAGGVRESPL